MKKSFKDLRQTAEYSTYMISMGWNVENIDGFNVFSKNIPLLGKVTKIQRCRGDIKMETLRSRVIYIEPTNKVPSGFEKATSCFIPSKTMQIDLEKSEEILLKNLKQKTRYNIKLAIKNCVKVEKSKDIGSFLDLWHKSARERGMWFSQKKEIESLWNSFGKNAVLYFASISDEVLAGLLIIYTKDTAYYMYAASSENGKSLFAPTLLTWQAIFDAKKNKKLLFDFDGIYDERYPNTKDWKGFTKFKEGFGGEVITYPGTFVKYSNPIFKLLNF